MSSASPNDVVQRFDDATMIIFKHSRMCDLSAERLRVARSVVGSSQIPLTIVPVQNERPLSNAIAELFGIQHASPQAIALLRGKVIDVRTHWGITREWLRDTIDALTGQNAGMSRSQTEPRLADG
jgi:bacillithiol system protein YtxJ